MRKLFGLISIMFVSCILYAGNRPELDPFQNLAGTRFIASHYFNDLADNATAYFVLDASTDTVSFSRMSIGITIDANSDIQVSVYENVQGTIGAQLSNVNINRENSATSAINISTATVISDVGTLIYNGTKAPSQRFIFDALNSNRYYSVVVENESGAAQVIGIVIDWYEN